MSRAEWTVEDALYFTDVVSRACHDDQLNDRRGAVESSFRTANRTRGLKKLEDYLPKPLVRKPRAVARPAPFKVGPLDLTDDSNAQSLFIEHGEDLRYLPNEARRLWVYWNDVIWQRDRMGYVTHMTAGALKKKADILTAGSRDAKFIEKVRRELLNMPGINSALDRLIYTRRSRSQQRIRRQSV